MSFQIDDFDNNAKWLGFATESAMLDIADDRFAVTLVNNTDLGGLRTIDPKDLSETRIGIYADRQCGSVGLTVRLNARDDNPFGPSSGQYAYTIFRQIKYGIRIFDGYGWIKTFADPVDPNESALIEIAFSGTEVIFYYNGVEVYRETRKLSPSAVYVYAWTRAWGTMTSETLVGTTTFQSYPPPKYVLTVQSTIGGVRPVPGEYSYTEGTIVKVDVEAQNGYKFDHSELDGTNLGSTTPIMVTMDMNHILLAVFIEVPMHTLTVDSTPIQGVPLTITEVN